MGDRREPGLAARGPRLTHLLLHRAWTVHHRRCGRRRVMMARIAVVAAASRSSARPLERSRGVRSTGKTVLVFEFELLRRVVQTASKHRSFVKTRAHTASAPRTPRRSRARFVPLEPSTCCVCPALCCCSGGPARIGAPGSWCGTSCIAQSGRVCPNSYTRSASAHTFTPGQLDQAQKSEDRHSSQMRQLELAVVRSCRRDLLWC